MINGRNAIWIIPLALFLTFPWWKTPVAFFLMPGGDLTNGSDTRKRAEGYNFIMDGITILQSEDDQDSATIRAKRAHSTETANEYVLEKIDGDIVDGRGHVINVLADRGTYNVDLKRLELMDNVVITNRGDNYTMKTDLLYYEGATRIIYCPSETLLQGDGIVITGSSLHHDMDSGKYTLGGRVRCLLAGEADS